MVVLPIALIALITFSVSAISSVVAILRKRGTLNSLIVIGAFPILVVVIYKAPFPGYIDGMHKTIKEALPLNEIVRLSVEAKEINPDWLDYEEHYQLIKKLRTKYPNALSLSHIPPRIEVSDNYVTVFYGSALVKHWGYLFTESDTFPIERIPEGMYKKVL